jgi:hypothetical protein
MSNRVQYFMRRIILNSKLNREKIVNNIKFSNQKIQSKNKNNHNMIIKRKMSTYTLPLSFCSNGNKKGPNNQKNNPFIYMLIGSMGIYIPSILTNEKNKK